MPRQTKPLTEVTIRNAKPGVALWDGGGLHLIRRDGRLHWRLKYIRPDGRENRLALGAYPTVSLKAARQLRDKARTLLATGTDPAELRTERRAQAKETFGRFAAEWLAVKSKSWAIETRRKAELVVNDYLVPAIGRRSVRDVTSADVVAILRKINAHAPSLTRKASQAAQAVIRTAITAGAREDGRVLDLNLRDSLPAIRKGHFPAATLPAEVGEVLRKISAYPSPVTRAALLVAAYTGQRPGNVAAMRWADVDLEAAEWVIPDADMKMRNAHIVPLPRQAVKQLNIMKQFTAGGEFVFPPLARQKTPHLHRDSLSKALRDIGLRGKQTPHGFRATLRTVARERLGISADVLEAQIAHAKRGEVQAAYDRTKFDDERRKVMQQWANYLDTLRDGAEVVPIRRKTSGGSQ